MYVCDVPGQLKYVAVLQSEVARRPFCPLWRMMNGCLLLGAFCQFWRSQVNTFTLTRKLCDLSGPLANEQARRARPSEIQRVAFGQSLCEWNGVKLYDRQMALVRGSQKMKGVVTEGRRVRKKA